ncbi:hypothetical protein EJ03DRAFT_373617 [Teratosphaeria nubilosa]|uniref:Uncharacterized protein n=1 Tax=Teratosphaeria nubilosa TaxID=161662 RepID=A0A6G1LCB2_9PEZI|nr:hypothetical protein EJ03DRAFT_373617 [Teratosphaeria nubilosa]
MAQLLYTIYETDQKYWWYDFDSAVNPDYALDYYSIYNDDSYTGVIDGAAQGTLQLNRHGCYQNLTKSWNCTAACLDPPEVTAPFWATISATYTLQNCMVFPVIAALLAGGNLTQTAVNVARKLDIRPDANLYKKASAGWPVINNCINEFCAQAGNRETAPGCNETGSTPFVSVANGSEYNQGSTAQSQNFTLPANTINYKLCDRLKAYVNPDIGGIGVFISYVMQMAIVLSGWLLYHWNDGWSVWPKTLFLLIFRRHYTRKKACDTALRHQEERRKSRHCAAIVSALAEFLTIVCVILSSVVWFQTSSVANAKATIVNYSGPLLPSCGAGVAPIKYCYSVDWFYRNATSSLSRAIPMFIFCYSVLVSIVIEHVRVFDFKVQAPGEETMVKGKIFDWVALNVLLIQDYYRIVLPSDNTALQYNNWSLGQVIAVAVWAPVFLEYLWIWNIGPEEGFKYKVHASRQVSNVSDTDQLVLQPQHGNAATVSETSVLPPKGTYEPLSRKQTDVKDYGVGHGPCQSDFEEASGSADRTNGFLRTTSWGPNLG